MLASWRWGVVFTILSELLPRKGALQAVWNPQLFQNAVGEIHVDEDWGDPAAEGHNIRNVSLGGESIPIKLGLLTSTIRSERWWLYGTMLQALHGYTSTLASWTEGCDCHFWLQARHTTEAQALEHTRARLGLPINAGDGLRRGPCPLAGCRAPALAAGAWKQHMMSMFDMNVEEILANAGCVSGPDIAAVSPLWV